MSIPRDPNMQYARPTPHPGEFLRLDFLPDYNLTAGALAKRMGLPDRQRVERLIRGKVGVTADTALRLGLVFSTTPELWLRLQMLHDLSTAQIAAREAGSLDAVEPLPAPEAA